MSGGGTGVVAFLGVAWGASTGCKRLWFALSDMERLAMWTLRASGNLLFFMNFVVFDYGWKLEFSSENF